jgi:hypothetical protein
MRRWVCFWHWFAGMVKEFMALNPERDSSSMNLHCKKHLYC